MERAGAIIRRQLDLALRLIDTTTANPPVGGIVRFSRDGKLLPSMNKGEGNYVFMDLGREDFLMRIEIEGYDTLELPVRYGELDERMPIMDVFLMPSENAYRGGRVLTFSGRLPRLTAIEAVNLTNPICTISDYDEKKKLITLFLPNRRIDMEGVYYGLVHEQEGGLTYERFEVDESVSSVTIRIKTPLEQGFTLNAPISRVVLGKVDQKGNFVLRVRDNSSELKYLIRCIADGREGFQEVDFHRLEGVKLKRPPKPKAGEEANEDGQAE